MEVRNETAMEDLEDVRGKAGGGEDGEDVFGACGGLRGWFEDEGVAGEKGGNEGIDENKVGVLRRMLDLLASILCQRYGQSN